MTTIDAAIGAIQAQGWIRTAAYISQDGVDQALEYLKSCKVYPGCHVQYSAGPATTWENAQGANVLCWSMMDALLCQPLLECALSNFQLARAWLGTDDPVLYSMNVFCTRPGPVRPDIQDWHRDTDDVKFIPLFIPLTDNVVQCLRMPDGQVVTIGGLKPGEAFFSNTMLEHYGIVPQHERIIAWARWGVSDPPASYVWDKLQPIDKDLLGPRYPKEPHLQRMLRLVAR